MNRVRSLLKFSSPARTFPRFKDDAVEDPKEPYNPPGSFVTLCCTNRWTEAHVLRYADGLKVHNIAFGQWQAFRMTNCCNGLVGVYGHDGFWIANPSIPRVAALPRCSLHVCRLSASGKIHRFDMPHAAIGLADASTEEHKVVRMFVREWSNCRPTSLGCEVLLSLEMESPPFWKKVDDPPVYTIAMFSMPLVVDGIVYWMVRRTPGLGSKSFKIRSKFRRSVVALCFNLREEKFSLLHHPEGWVKRRPRLHLFLLGGRPCLVDAFPWTERMTLWSLEDHVSSEWVRLGNFGVKDDGVIECYYNERKVYYELPTMDYDDAETMGLLYKETEHTHEMFMGDDIVDDTWRYSSIMEYCASYTDSNFWPF